MKSKWNTKIAKKYVNFFSRKKIKKDLALRIYTTNLIGHDPNLVLHGGGNTSVKSYAKNINGKDIGVIYVKGSGWDMANLNEEGMPGLELSPLIKTLKFKKLSDKDMVNYLRKNLLNNKSPNPSVETLLHAFLPHKYIDHTHSVSILSIANQKQSKEICMKIFGKKIAVVPYIMPGFDLALQSYKVFSKNRTIEGLILLNHGIFTFGDTAEQSYKRMIEYVTLAEKYINKTKKLKIKKINNIAKYDIENLSLQMRKAIYSLTNKKWILNFFKSKELTELLFSKNFIKTLSEGPVTPDHVIRIKPNPMILNLGVFKNSIDLQINKYAKNYSKYFNKYKYLVKGSVQTDPIPRIIILPGGGIFSVGRNLRESQIAKDIFLSAINSIKGANQIGRFKSISPKEIFKMEYWPLERAKIASNNDPDLIGNVVVITGGCGTIGLATAEQFINEGAEVILLDNDKKNIFLVPNKIKNKSTQIYCDVTNKFSVKKVLNTIVTIFGGIDIVISNAGKAFEGEMAEVDIKIIKKSYDINFFSHQILSQESVKILKRQQLGGLILFNISKQSINPGKGFGPYGLPKSSTLFLMKQYTLEYSKYNIRFNGVNADRIQSGILNKKLINKRAKARGLSEKNYLKSNLLQTEIHAIDVAKAFLFQAKLTKTTGNIITVDGGNIEASLR